MALLITFILGLFFVVGILIIRLNSSEIIEHISLSMAAGAMVALVCLDLFPEIIEGFGIKGLPIAGVLVICGGVLLKLLDMFVPEHEAHDEHNDESMVHIGIMSAVAIILHNIIEGITVYSIADRDIASGLSLGLGVGLHNIPMGMLIFATLKREKSMKKYLILFLAVISTFLGGLLMQGLSGILTETFLEYMVCITLGMVLFIIIFELVPSIFNAKNKIASVLGILVGFAIVLISSGLE